MLGSFFNFFELWTIVPSASKPMETERLHTYIFCNYVSIKPEKYLMNANSMIKGMKASFQFTTPVSEICM